MPSIYDRMTAEQLQIQIQQTHRLSRARVATLIAESKLRRAQFMQTSELERESLSDKENALRHENQKAIQAESKERIKSAKDEREEKLKQMQKTGHSERGYLRTQFAYETQARVRAVELESDLRMELMREEHGLKMQLMREESAARQQGSRSGPKGSTHARVSVSSRMASRQQGNNSTTGETKTSMVASGEPADRYTPTGRENVDGQQFTAGTATQQKSPDTTLLESMNAQEFLLEMNERIRRLKVSNGAILKRGNRILEENCSRLQPAEHGSVRSSMVEDDATIELTDVSPPPERSASVSRNTDARRPIDWSHPRAVEDILQEYREDRIRRIMKLPEEERIAALTAMMN